MGWVLRVTGRHPDRDPLGRNGGVLDGKPTLSHPSVRKAAKAGDFNRVWCPRSAVT